MKKQNLFQRIRNAIFSEQTPQIGGSVPSNLQPVGSSGTEIFAGYFTEEYLHLLTGRRAADVYDKMRRSDGKIKMVLSAVKNPIRSATWEVEAAGDEPDYQRHAELVRHILFHDMDKPWSQTVNEGLSCVDFGHALFEEEHKVVLNHADFGSYIGLRSLGFRAQKTLERWNMDNRGELLSVTQYAQGDLERHADIPAKFLMVVTLEKEGSNFEGISMLRPCYGAWLRKTNYQKMNAIGIEKLAVPPPVLKYPGNKFNTEEYTNAIAALRAYTTAETNWITLPQGWDLEFAESTFDPAKLQGSIDAENKEIVFAFLANFLELGMSGGGGSYSLGSDLSDFFLGGIKYVADTICEAKNRGPIKRLVDLNFGPQKKYPQLKASGIDDKAGLEFAQILDALAKSKYITPDDPLEEHMRKRMNLPKKSNVGVRTIDPPKPMAFAERKRVDLQLAEKAALTQIRDGKKQVLDLMQTHMKEMGNDLVAQLISKARALPEAQRGSAYRSVEPKGSMGYRAALKEAIAGVALEALAQARREVPKARNIKLSDFDDLPPSIKKKIQSQVDLIISTQEADVEKALYFQFASSVGSTDSLDLIQKDLAAKMEQYLGGSGITAAAGNLVSLSINETRNAFFFDPEVLDEIEAFTFVNGDPQSPICQDLAGTVFATNDPESQRFFPPLHHNCESYIVPIPKGGMRGREIDPTGLKPSSPDLEKSITLSQWRICC